MNRVFVAALCMLLFSGCHTMRFEVSNDGEAIPVSESKSFYLFGLVPTKNVDLAEHCPKGTAAIVEETTFLDGLLGGITLGIYTPRTSRYYCVKGEA